MILHRLSNRLPRPNFEAIDAALTQFRWFRTICGGIYVKMDNRWYGATPILILGDGSRILRRCDDTGASFHETYMGIQRLEEHS